MIRAALGIISTLSPQLEGAPYEEIMELITHLPDDLCCETVMPEIEKVKEGGMEMERRFGCAKLLQLVNLRFPLPSSFSPFPLLSFAFLPPLLLDFLLYHHLLYFLFYHHSLNPPPIPTQIKVSKESFDMLLADAKKKAALGQPITMSKIKK